MARRAATETVSEARIRSLRERLQRWFVANQRDLPWRRTRDPYAILVSEAMLQQTRVETVVSYFQRFLERFPSFEALAEAPRDDVLAHWAGLGYYRRAANLQACAAAVVERHGGRLPSAEAELLALPGIGRYTAGAIRSIAFGQEAPILDGNVVRVLSRLFRIPDGLGAAKDRIWELAARLVRRSRPRDLNQALMELGATVCTPRTPRCDACPVAKSCAARQYGDVEAFPSGKVEPRVRPLRLDLAWIERDDRVLLVRRPAHGLWANLWDLPGFESEGAAEPQPSAIARGIEELIGSPIDLERPLARRVHVLSHRRVDARVWRARLREAERVGEGGCDAHEWVERSAPKSRGTSTLLARLWQDVLEAERQPDLPLP